MPARAAPAALILLLLGCGAAPAPPPPREPDAFPGLERPAVTVRVSLDELERLLDALEAAAGPLREKLARVRAAATDYLTGLGDPRGWGVDRAHPIEVEVAATDWRGRGGWTLRARLRVLEPRLLESAVADLEKQLDPAWGARIELSVRGPFAVVDLVRGTPVPDGDAGVSAALVSIDFAALAALEAVVALHAVQRGRDVEAADARVAVGFACVDLWRTVATAAPVAQLSAAASPLTFEARFRLASGSARWMQQPQSPTSLRRWVSTTSRCAVGSPLVALVAAAAMLPGLKEAQPLLREPPGFLRLVLEPDTLEALGLPGLALVLTGDLEADGPVYRLSLAPAAPSAVRSAPRSGPASRPRSCRSPRR